MKKIGVICDNYKVEKFKEEFDKAGLGYTVNHYKGMFTLFVVLSEQNIVQPIVDKVTKYFKNN